MDKIDWSEFHVIQPKSKKPTPLIVTVATGGRVRLNAALSRAVGGDTIELRLKNDGKVLVLLPSGAAALHIKKNGELKNYEVTELLEAAKIKLPAYYICSFDEEHQAFIGEYLAYNPTSKRSKTL